MPVLMLPILLLGIPILEIAVFILIGDAIGLWPTLLMIFVTAVIGTTLLRWQGLGLVRTIQTETNSGRVPGEALGHGAMILVAGILLLTPGFVTDALGFLLFIPPFRHMLWKAVLTNMTVVSMGAQRSGFSNQGPQGQNRGRGPVVDLDDNEWQESDCPNSSSPWIEPDDPRR